MDLSFPALKLLRRLAWIWDGIMAFRVRFWMSHKRVHLRYFVEGRVREFGRHVGKRSQGVCDGDEGLL